MVRRRAIRAAAAASCLLLWSCAHSRYVEHPITAWFTAAPAAAPSPAPVGAADTHCHALAKQRMRDVAFQGEDEATQRTVYRLTYDDCRAWARHHG